MRDAGASNLESDNKEPPVAPESLTREISDPKAYQALLPARQPLGEASNPRYLALNTADLYQTAQKPAAGEQQELRTKFANESVDQDGKSNGWTETKSYYGLAIREYKLSNNQALTFTPQNDKGSYMFRLDSDRSSSLFTIIPNGSTIDTKPDGNFTITQPDGTKIVSSKIDSNFVLQKTSTDGASETRSSDGHTITVKDGVKTTTFSKAGENITLTEPGDGSSIEVGRSDEGTKIRTKTTDINGKITETIKSVHDQPRTTYNKDGSQRLESPYLDKDGKPYGYMIVENEGPNFSISKVYDVDLYGNRVDDPNASGELAESKRNLIKKLQHDYKGITFSSDNDPPERLRDNQPAERLRNNQPYSHRNPTYRELKEIEAALFATYPANVKADGNSIGFTFLNAPQLQDEFGRKGDAVQRRELKPGGEEKVYIFNNVAQILARELPSSGEGGDPFTANPYKKLVAHELIHHEDKLLDPRNAGTYLQCQEIAEACGFKLVQDSADNTLKWAVLAENNDLWVQSANGWHNVSRVENEIPYEAIAGKAKVKHPETRSYDGPTEASAVMGALDRLSAQSEKKLKEEYKVHHETAQSRKLAGVQRVYGAGTVRNEQGAIVPIPK